MLFSSFDLLTTDAVIIRPTPSAPEHRQPFITANNSNDATKTHGFDESGNDIVNNSKET